MEKKLPKKIRNAIIDAFIEFTEKEIPCSTNPPDEWHDETKREYDLITMYNNHIEKKLLEVLKPNSLIQNNSNG